MFKIILIGLALQTQTFGSWQNPNKCDEIWYEIERTRDQIQDMLNRGNYDYAQSLKERIQSLVQEAQRLNCVS